MTTLKSLTFLVFVSVFGLVSCGQSNTGTATSSSSSTTTSTSTTSTTTTTATTTAVMPTPASTVAKSTAPAAATAATATKTRATTAQSTVASTKSTTPGAKSTSTAPGAAPAKTAPQTINTSTTTPGTKTQTLTRPATVNTNTQPGTQTNTTRGSTGGNTTPTNTTTGTNQQASPTGGRPGAGTGTQTNTQTNTNPNTQTTGGRGGNNTNTQTGGNIINTITDGDATSAIKEALMKGIQVGVDKVSVTDGYFKNAKIKIPLPAQVKTAESTLRSVGMGSVVDNMLLSMNRAAESAAKQAGPIFINGIKQMTVTDAVSIVSNQQPDAATQFLKRTTSESLVTAFKPSIKTALDKTLATKYWTQITSYYNKIPMVKPINTDLNDFVTRKAIDGLFYMVAQEEAKIRKAPIGTGSDIIDKVFGSVIKR